MNTPTQTPASAPETPSLAARAVMARRAAALAVLEQMYGYFSYDPMPLERAGVPLAA